MKVVLVVKNIDGRHRSWPDGRHRSWPDGRTPFFGLQNFLVRFFFAMPEFSTVQGFDLANEQKGQFTRANGFLLQKIFPKILSYDQMNMKSGENNEQYEEC